MSIGQVLKIPTKEETPTKENVYTVKSGDSLYSIAREFDTTVSEIMKLNNLTSTSLSIGQTLEIPTKEQASNTYTVKSGDSLYSIARRYNTTVDELRRLNNLTSTSLSIGQVLKIPTATDTSSQTYTVKSGDSLYSIARKYNTTVDELKRLNNLTSTLLSIGQIIRVK